MERKKNPEKSLRLLAGCDAETFRRVLSDLLDQWSEEKKRIALYLILVDALGKEQKDEMVICNLEKFVYGYFVRPGKREQWRLLEDPTYAKRLHDALKEETVPLRQAMEEAAAQFR